MTTTTVAETRLIVAQRLRAAGLDSAELDARIIVGHALRLDHAALAAGSARQLEASEKDAIATLANRRLAREPVARIVGHKEFWSLKISLNAATLVPRPETETVVEAALTAIGRAGSRSRPLRIADLGTGSGAVLLALLSELRDAVGIGTDVSESALVMARQNARRLGLARAAFAACDMASALAGGFDLIVSNPPYIPTADIAALEPEVRDFDPRVALDGGSDGMDGHRAIATAASGLLTPGGVLVVEFGPGQADGVCDLLSGAGLAPLQVHHDLSFAGRAVTAMKAA